MIRKCIGKEAALLTNIGKIIENTQNTNNIVLLNIENTQILFKNKIKAADILFQNINRNI